MIIELTAKEISWLKVCIKAGIRAELLYPGETTEQELQELEDLYMKIVEGEL